MMNKKFYVLDTDGGFLGYIPTDGLDEICRYKIAIEHEFVPFNELLLDKPHIEKICYFEIERHFNFFVCVSGDLMDVMKFLKRYNR